MKIPRWVPLLVGLISLVLLTAAVFFAVKGNPVLSEASQAVLGLEEKIYFPLFSNYSLPPAPNTAPLASPSYYFYMRYYTPERARAEGCKMGTRDANNPGKQERLVILDFGVTKYINGQYGASGMWTRGFFTMDQIAEAVKEFGLGYWICTESDYDSHLTIGIGTNNYNNSDVYSNLSVTYGHGREWAKMVNSVSEYFLSVCTSGCNGQVSVMGANDIELAWSSPQAALDWLDGYDSANLYPLINFGAAEGCPNACGGGGHTWTKEQVWRVQNSGPVYALPEIYLNDGRNASQWYQMSQYAVQTHGRPYDFIGVMTNFGACQQYPESACNYIDNTPPEGWTQLYNLVNGPNLLTWDSIPYVTDICWWEGNTEEDCWFGEDR